MLQMYVLNISSFSRMLQLFHLSVAKVDLDVRLLSEEERANVGAMVAAMWGGGAGCAAPVWKRRGSHPSGVKRWARSGVEEAGDGRDRNESSGRRGQRSGKKRYERGCGKRSWPRAADLAWRRVNLRD